MRQQSAPTQRKWCNAPSDNRLQILPFTAGTAAELRDASGWRITFKYVHTCQCGAGIGTGCRRAVAVAPQVLPVVLAQLRFRPAAADALQLPEAALSNILMFLIFFYQAIRNDRSASV